VVKSLLTKSNGLNFIYIAYLKCLVRLKNVKRLLNGYLRSPCGSEPIPMRKLSTGEPCAGELHARFGGRGELKKALLYPNLELRAPIFSYMKLLLI
jgi:hypothetical protein